MLDPGEPALAIWRLDRNVGRAQTFAFHKGGVRHQADIDAEIDQVLTGKRERIAVQKKAEPIISVKNAAVAVAMNNQVA